mmetsp:Transcript_7190/g.21161  ORF Transcript_7190/g.21161 Transcript_7190/m.21161 type:complete len:274 (-) Transcript_7190:766-1587(-)
MAGCSFRPRSNCSRETSPEPAWSISWNMSFRLPMEHIPDDKALEFSLQWAASMQVQTNTPRIRFSRQTRSKPMKSISNAPTMELVVLSSWTNRQIRSGPHFTLRRWTRVIERPLAPTVPNMLKEAASLPSPPARPAISTCRLLCVPVKAMAWAQEMHRTTRVIQRVLWKASPTAWAKTRTGFHIRNRRTTLKARSARTALNMRITDSEVILGPEIGVSTQRSTAAVPMMRMSATSQPSRQGLTVPPCTRMTISTTKNDTAMCSAICRTASHPR